MGAILLCSTFGIAQDNLWSSGRPDGHAPISIMADHYHKKGEIMFSYRFMPMWMSGNLSSAKEISEAEIHEDYMVAPQKMKMTMQMLGFMYAMSDGLTFAVMGNHIANDMDLVTGMGEGFVTKSSGFGDASVSGLWKIVNGNKQSLHTTIGISIPTGNIDQRDNTPMMANAQLVYPMQLGSGTWDPYLGVTYLGQSTNFSWGLQPSYKLRLGTNTEDYALGNLLNVVAWGAIKASDYLSFSTSINYCNLGEITGQDADLNPMMMPLFNTVNSGRNQMDLGVGSNFYISSGGLKNLRLGLEVKIPVSQSVNGIQMKNTLATTFGVQYSL